MDAVLADRDDDGVLTLTFNRPERRNGRSEDIATACYARLADAAADPARFATSFARRGLIAEYGVAWTLTRLVGQARPTCARAGSRSWTGGHPGSPRSTRQPPTADPEP